MRNFLLIATLLAVAPVWAQNDSVTVKDKPENELTLDAQLMTRGEIRRGGLITQDKVQDAEKANFIVERTRLAVGYKRDVLSMRVNIQHVGLWGAEGEGKNLDLHEAWAQLSKYGLFVKVGRQELCYDDERILGRNDWSMAGYSHDVLKFGYEGHGHQAHAFLAYNQNNKNMYGGTYYSGGYLPYKSMQGVWYHYDVPKFPLGASLLFMNIGMECGVPTNHHTVNQQLYGGYLSFNPGRFSTQMSYYRQSGRASLDYTSGADVPLKAWMGNVRAQYDISNMFSAYAGFDYISGDESFVVPDPGHIGMTQHTELNSFTTLLGSTRNFYGAMDFFYVSTYFSTYSPGLQHLYGGTVVRPLKNLSVDLGYHYMATATKISGLNMTLGHNVELSASYQLMKDVSISAGYSYMSGTYTMERLKRSTADHKLRWGWLMLVVSPQIFSTKWK
jgi:hypothetical protein